MDCGELNMATKSLSLFFIKIKTLFPLPLESKLDCLISKMQQKRYYDTMVCHPIPIHMLIFYPNSTYSP